MELASLIISITAIICSVVSVIINFYQNQAITSLNLQARYFEKIFDDYLVREIPKARKYARYINNRFIDADKLIDVLDDVKSNSLYFKYNNDAFYQELTKSIDDLEIFLSNCSNKNELDQDKQSENIIEIGNKIKVIYKIIHTYSTGSISH